MSPTQHRRHDLASIWGSWYIFGPATFNRVRTRTALAEACGMGSHHIKTPSMRQLSQASGFELGLVPPPPQKNNNDVKILGRVDIVFFRAKYCIKSRDKRQYLSTSQVFTFLFTCFAWHLHVALVKTNPLAYQPLKIKTY